MAGSPALFEIARAGYPGHADSARRVRRFIADLLGRDWPRLDDVLALASELASNAGAPRGALLYPRYSREGLEGYPWA